MNASSEKRPIGFVPIGIFFFFGATMATYAALTLVIPGTFLDRAWKLNPEGHVQLASLGRIIGVPFLVLATTLFLAGIGWFRRHAWGWRLGVTLIAINMTGDLFNLVFRRELLKGTVGVAVAGLLLVYMSRARVRDYVQRNAF